MVQDPSFRTAAHASANDNNSGSDSDGDDDARMTTLALNTSVGEDVPDWRPWSPGDRGMVAAARRPDDPVQVVVQLARQRLARASVDVSDTQAAAVLPEVKLHIVQHTEGHRYFGTLVNGVCEGAGRMVYPSGSVYIGEWTAGMRDGEGVLVTPTTIFTGVFHNDAYSKGTLLHPNGEKYQGSFVNNMAHGSGVQTFGSGIGAEHYAGTFEYGAREGHGTYTFSTGECYVGQWSSDKMHGHGAHYGVDSTMVRAGHYENGIFIDNTRAQIEGNA